MNTTEKNQFLSYFVQKVVKKRDITIHSTTLTAYNKERKQRWEKQLY